MPEQVTTGNVFRDQESGKILNPQNVRPKEATRVNVFGPATGRTAVRGASLAHEEDDEGRPVSSESAAEAGVQANVRETLDTVSRLAQDVRKGNRAARTMIDALAAQERTRPDGGRATVLRKLQQLGV